MGGGIIMEGTHPLLLGPFYLVKWLVNLNILAASVYIELGFEVQGFVSTSKTLLPPVQTNSEKFLKASLTVQGVPH